MKLGKPVWVNFEKPEESHKWSRICRFVDMDKKGQAAFPGKQIKLGEQMILYGEIIISDCDRKSDSLTEHDARRKGIKDMTLWTAHQVATDEDGNFKVQKISVKGGTNDEPKRFEEFKSFVSKRIKEARPNLANRIMLWMGTEEKNKKYFMVLLIITSAIGMISGVLSIFSHF